MFTFSQMKKIAFKVFVKRILQKLFNSSNTVIVKDTKDFFRFVKIFKYLRHSSSSTCISKSLEISWWTFLCLRFLLFLYFVLKWSKCTQLSIFLLGVHCQYEKQLAYYYCEVLKLGVFDAVAFLHVL